MPVTPEIMLGDAQLAWGAGHLLKADVLARLVLERQPCNADAAGLIARITQAVAPIKAPPGSILVIKAWGFGFWADVDHVLSGLLLAEITGRTPVVHWGANSLFQEPAAPRASSAWDHSFEPVSNLTPADVAARLAARADADQSVFPSKWTGDNLLEGAVNPHKGPWSRLSALYFLSRAEPIAVYDYHTSLCTLIPWIPAGHRLHGLNIETVYRDLVGRHLRLRPDLARQIDAFAAAHFAPGPTVAVHIRGSDKFAEFPGAMAAYAQYPSLIARFSSAPGTRLFLLTDDANAARQFTLRYPGRVVSTDCLRSSTGRGLHYQREHDRRRLAAEVIVDTYLAARCDAFMGLGPSNVSCMILHLKNWPKDRCAILGPPVHHIRQFPPEGPEIPRTSG